MWPGGVIKADPDYMDKDVSIQLKFVWWRGVSGRLSIQGRRLDASARCWGLKFGRLWRPWLPGEWGRQGLGDPRAGQPAWRAAPPDPTSQARAHRPGPAGSD